MATPSEQTKSNANRTDSSRSQEDEEEKLSEVVGDLLTSVQDVQVGMKLEAKDAYGKWYIHIHEKTYSASLIKPHHIRILYTSDH